MDNRQKAYYWEMLRRGRLFRIVGDGQFKGVITYYIGNGNVNKYVRSDPWSIVDDEPTTGDTCYIDQMITTKEKNNGVYSRSVMLSLVNYIRELYPQVIRIRWNRYKGGESHVYFKNLGR